MAGSSAETAVPATRTANPMDNAARQTGTATATSNTTQASNAKAVSTAPSTANASSNAASTNSAKSSNVNNNASTLGRAVGTYNLLNVIQNLLNTQNQQQQKITNPVKKPPVNTPPQSPPKGGTGGTQVPPVPAVGDAEDLRPVSYPDSSTSYQSHLIDPFNIKIKSNLMQGFNAGEPSSSVSYDRADNPTGYYGQLLFGARGKPRDPRFQW
jgi:hypothetical protein